MLNDPSGTLDPLSIVHTLLEPHVAFSVTSIFQNPVVILVDSG